MNQSFRTKRPNVINNSMTTTGGGNDPLNDTLLDNSFRSRQPTYKIQANTSNINNRISNASRMTVRTNNNNNHMTSEI